MKSGLACGILLISLFVATAAPAQAPTVVATVKPSHGKASRPSAAPASGASRQVLDDLVKGSPDQQAAERNDNDRSGLKAVDHRKDDFFSDWRGIR